MIVDNSIVIIDSYLEKLGEGVSRWHASIQSATHFFKSIFSATCAISITFFPFLITTTGQIQDFLVSFPWAISIVLGVSLLVAALLVPFMQFYFIRKPMESATDKNGKSSVTIIKTQDTVYLKEITAPQGYVVNATATNVKLVASKTSSVTVENKEQLAELTIYKEGQVLSGADVSENGTVFQYENRRQKNAVYNVLSLIHI